VSVELGSLALRYVPFLAMFAIGLLVTLDARVRVKRPGRMRWLAPVQLLLAIGMVVLAIVAIVVSPEIGLLEATGAGKTPPALTATLAAFIAAGGLGLLTLAGGLAWPARPHPRRGLTSIALLLDGLGMVVAGIQSTLA
jgi:hypothetical protein